MLSAAAAFPALPVPARARVSAVAALLVAVRVRGVARPGPRVQALMRQPEASLT